VKDTEDPLAFLLSLNLALADNEDREQKVTPPDLPSLMHPDAKFMSRDCVGVAEP
jgi:hypothetical protein